MMDLINKGKPMLTSSMNIQNAQEEELFNKIFAKESTKFQPFLNAISLKSSRFCEIKCK